MCVCGYDFIDVEFDVDKLIIEINYSFFLLIDYDKMLDVFVWIYIGYCECILVW